MSLPVGTAQAVLHGLADAVVVADRTGRIRYVNDAAGRLLGYPAGDLPGREIVELVPERLRAAHLAGFQRFLGGGTPRLIGMPTRVPALRADGTEHDVDLVLSSVGEGDDLTLVATLRDVTGQVAMEREIEASRFLAASVEVTERLHRARSVDEALAAVLPTLCARLDWDLAALWLVDREADVLHCHDLWRRAGSGPAAVMEQATRGQRFHVGEGLPGRVAEDMVPVFYSDLATEDGMPRLRAAMAAGFRCAAALPLVSGKDLLGVIEFFNRIPIPVSDEMLAMMEAVGRQIGQFVDRLEGEERLRELAEALQASLLPPRVPEIPGLEVAALYRSGVVGLTVGGDMYDVFPVGAGRWTVVIGDVCGKGAAAASATAVARYAARAAAIDHPEDPAHVLSTVNEALVRDSTERPFLTAACAVVSPQPSGATMRLAVAGHPLPMLVTRDGRVSEIGAPGQLLGVLAQIEVTSVDVRLETGDTALFFTDGVVEARTGRGEQFGEERLRELLGSGARLPLPHLVNDVARAATRFAADSPHDDMALVALRPSR